MAALLRPCCGCREQNGRTCLVTPALDEPAFNALGMCHECTVKQCQSCSFGVLSTNTEGFSRSVTVLPHSCPLCICKQPTPPAVRAITKVTLAPLHKKETLQTNGSLETPPFHAHSSHNPPYLVIFVQRGKTYKFAEKFFSAPSCNIWPQNRWPPSTVWY